MVSPLRRLMPTYIFTPPTVDEGPLSIGSPLWRFFKQTRGISIAKSGGVYSQQRWIDADTIATYDEYYQGGFKHSVSAAVRTALIAGGVGVTSANFVEE